MTLIKDGSAAHSPARRRPSLQASLSAASRVRFDVGLLLGAGDVALLCRHCDLCDRNCAPGVISTCYCYTERVRGEGNCGMPPPLFKEEPYEEEKQPERA